MFLSITLIILVLVMIQVLILFVGNYRYMAANWKREVFEEFVSSVRRAIQGIDSADGDSVINIMAANTSERVSGLIIRDGNGDFVISLGMSPEGKEVPSPRRPRIITPSSGRFSAFYQKSIEYTDVKVAPPKYEMAITARNDFPAVQSIDFRPIFSQRKQWDTVELPSVLTDQDIAGSVMISVNDEPRAYIDVLVYKIDFYAPTAFALRELLLVFFVSLPLSLLVTILLAAIYAKKVEKGTRGIQKALSSLSKGDFNVKLPKQNTIETDEIATSIESLAGDLKRHQKSRKEWIRNISHDLNTPLASIQLLVDGALDGVFPVDEDFLSKLKAETATLASRISSVRYYSYLLSPDVKISKRKLEIPADLAVLTEKCTVNGSAFIYADPDLMSRAMEEVIGNAEQYGDPSSRPLVNISRTENSCVITVSNRGSLPKPLPQFFEPWARGDEARSEGGSGLGLPIVYQIMDLHGGTVSIDEKNGYVTVTLIFPDASSALPC